MKRIIISRINNPLDAVFSLPLAGYLKKQLPESYIIFFGTENIKSIINSSIFIDEFVDTNKFSELSFLRKINFIKSFKADVIINIHSNITIYFLSFLSKIPFRIGKNEILYNFLLINNSINFKKSENLKYHITQRNIKFAKALISNITIPEITEIHNLFGILKFSKLNNNLHSAINPNKFNVILHPISDENSRDWGLHRYSELVRLLSPQKFNIIITGTNEDAEKMEQFLKVYSYNIIDLTGKLILNEHISLIAHSDGIVSCNISFLHIAAAIGKHAIGIFSPLKQISTKQYAPIGKNSFYFVVDKKCNKCDYTSNCECITSITANEVANKLEECYSKKFLNN